MFIQHSPFLDLLKNYIIGITMLFLLKEKPLSYSPAAPDLAGNAASVKGLPICCIHHLCWVNSLQTSRTVGAGAPLRHLHRHLKFEIIFMI